MSCLSVAEAISRGERMNPHGFANVLLSFRPHKCSLKIIHKNTIIFQGLKQLAQ